MHSPIWGSWGRALLCAAVLTLPLAHARELAPIDALGEAPPAVQRKAAQALPAQVQSLSREERLHYHDLGVNRRRLEAIFKENGL